VHGGYVAHLFDQILGQHNLYSQIPAMTGTLSVRYRRPTPLYTDLDFEVHTEHASGRKILARGVLRSGDEIVAEAEGLFVMPRDFAANVAKALRGQS
jgi:acyl-coenzyme A thioesterase PaaI-like protein